MCVWGSVCLCALNTSLSRELFRLASVFVFIFLPDYSPELDQSVCLFVYFYAITIQAGALVMLIYIKDRLRSYT